MLTLTPLRLVHAWTFAQASRDPSFLKGLRYEHPVSLWQAMLSVLRTRKTAYAIRVGNSVVGRIGYTWRAGEPVLFFWIYPPYQGKGYGAEALRQLLQQQPLPYVALIKPWNIASQRVVEKNGLTYSHTENEYLVYRRTPSVLPRERVGD